MEKKQSGTRNASYGKAPDRAAVLKDALKTPGGLVGAWLLCGPEAYLYAYYRDQIRKKLIPDPDMGYFDHVRLSGAEKTDVPLGDRLAAACEGVPIMNESKLIELCEVSLGDMKGAALKAFLAAIENLPAYPYVTVLIVCSEEEFNTTDYRAESSSLWKSLAGAGVRIVPFPRQDKAKLRTWCGKHFATEAIDAPPYLIDKMIDRVGSSMTALLSEMQKLSCYLHASGRNTLADADIPYICCQTENAVDFGIQTAVRNRDIGALVREYRILKREKIDPMQLFFAISGAIGDLWKIKTGLCEGYTREDLMHIYKMKEYPMRLAAQGCANYSLPTLQRLQKLCAETDLLLKSAPIDGYVLVERLICGMTKLFEFAMDTEADAKKTEAARP